MTAARVSPDELNAASADDFVMAPAAIQERSPWVAAAVTAERPFANLIALDAAMAAVTPGVAAWSSAMPPGNITGMTAAERATIAAWLAAGVP